MFSPFPLFLFLPENNIDQPKNYISRCSDTLGRGGVSWIDKIDPVAEMSHWHTWSDSLGHVTFGTVAKRGLGKWRFVGGGFTYIFYFHPDPWGIDPPLRAYFSDGWFNHPTRMDFC